MTGELWAAAVALVLLLAGLGTGAVALTGVRSLESFALVLQVLAAPAWLLLSGPLEGPVLLVVVDQHGLTLSDLLTLPAALQVVALLVIKAGRERGAGHDRAPAP